MNRRFGSLLLAGGLSLSVLLWGCGRGEEADAAEDGDESVAATSLESALSTELSDEVDKPTTATGDALAASSAVRVPARFTPSGCATATAVGNRVTYVLTNCTGPFGLVKVTGTLVAVYSRGAAGQVQVVITGTGVKANSATVDVSATVLASMANGVKRGEVTSDSKGTGPRGTQVARKGTYAITFDTVAECLTVDGTWATTVGIRRASTTVTGYRRCKGTCPAAGGKIVHTTATSKVITLTYDGTAVAKWAVDGGRSGTVNLSCTP